MTSPQIAFLTWIGFQVLEMIQKVGATGVLLEYEDMFPYDGRLKNVVAKNHYSKSEVEQIVKKCEDLNLEVIPLVQTFGS